MFYLKVMKLSLSTRNLAAESDEEIFSNVSFNVFKGEIFGILGPSGSGKSLLLKIISGLIQPKEGEIYKSGENITHLPPKERKVAMVFQEIALYPHLKNIENIEFPFVLHHNEKEFDENLLHEVSKMLNIEKEKILDKKPKFSSLGERQKVAIGKALVSLPDILLFDEPFSNIEMNFRRELKNKIRKFLKERNITTIYVSHNQVEMAGFADRIGVLAEKRLQQVATYEELYNNPKTFFVSLYIGEIPNNYLTGDEVSFLTNDKIKYYITIRPDECLLEPIKNSIKISGNIVAIEPLVQENKKLFFIQFNNRNFGIILPVDSNFKINDVLEIYIPLEKAQFFEFDKNTELIERIYNVG